MSRRTLWWGVLAFLIFLFIILSIEESRTFLFALVLRVFFFLKKNILAILAAFFLVKGKFILTLFLKKIALLSATGLGKRYIVEKVITHNFKIHFLDYLANDMKRLVIYIKKNFKSFPLIKQIIAVFAFLSSLGFVGKFMGGMIAMKVFIAKIWSFLLALFLKFATVVVYFFTDYLWGSWIAPIVEVVIFTWLLSWMEKVPFLARGLQRIYAFFLTMFGLVEYYLEKLFHIPVKSFFQWLVKKVQQNIYKFIGYEKVSRWKRVKQRRVLNPNKHVLLIQNRKAKKQKESRYISSREALLQKRNMKK
jgi:hypothetical protein